MSKISNAITDNLLKELGYLEYKTIDDYLHTIQKKEVVTHFVHKIAFEAKEWANQKGFAIFTGKDFSTNLYLGYVVDSSDKIVIESKYDSELEAIFNLAERIRKLI